MLRGAGVSFESCPADIDETSIIQDSKAPPDDIALKLARAKALKVAQDHPEALVIGSDQILEFEGEIYEKAENIDAAKDRLRSLRGKTHRLISAAALVRNDEVLWEAAGEATLTMRNFDDAFLDSYASAAGDDLVSCVGAYAIEKAGAWLFSDVQGDYFVILGMPLLPLLGYLKDHHGVTP